MKEKKEYVIPLMTKTKWRVPDNKKVMGEDKVKEKVVGAGRRKELVDGGRVGEEKSQEEMELEREAVEAVWKGEEFM